MYKVTSSAAGDWMHKSLTDVELENTSIHGKQATCRRYSEKKQQRKSGNVQRKLIPNLTGHSNGLSSQLKLQLPIIAWVKMAPQIRNVVLPLPKSGKEE